MIAAGCLLTVAVATAQPPPQPRTPIRHDVVADDGHHLTVWQRRGAPPRATKILLIHGRTWSSLPNFDLRVAGEARSFMDALGTGGLDVFALDLRGYGATPRDPSGFLTPNRAVADVAAVVTWMQQQDTRKGGTYLMGLSRGAMIAGMAAQKHPEKFAGIVLLGFGFDPDAQAAPSEPGVRPGRIRNTSDAAAADFITRDAYTGATLSAFVRAALQHDPVLADWREEQQFNAFVPARVQVPVLLIHGDRDPQAPMAIGTKLFNRFGTPDKWWIILPGADHAAHLEKSAPLLARTVVNFTRRHETGRP